MGKCQAHVTLAFIHESLLKRRRGKKKNHPTCSAGAHDTDGRVSMFRLEKLHTFCEHFFFFFYAAAVSEQTDSREDFPHCWEWKNKKNHFATRITAGETYV